MAEPAPSGSERLAALFEQALDIAARDREAWLDKMCGDDAGLRKKLARLLRADARPAGILDGPPRLIVDAVATGGTLTDDPPRALGPYKLLRSIGAGGMGEVWLAERCDGEFEQRVAIKQLAYPTPGLLQRFRRERQILAHLEHPNVARLLDGGVDAQGAPYLVMEYVEGVPITDYVRTHALDLPACLRLFLHVCEAVQYAHQNLVVHRDLKPSNIFVTAEGTPKLLDFGIAKVLATTGDDAPTQTMARMLTPDYAAPEQFSGGTITTATDVYALGVVLYELLAGIRPARPSLPAANAIGDSRTSDPVPPSAATDRATGSARRRALRGDLDRIALTALAAEPRRRYPSAEALGSDIRRYLEGRPIAARGDSAMYRLRKFARRNRFALASAGFVFAVCIAATIVSLRQTHRARAEANRAEQQVARADAVQRFLIGVFQQATPDENRGQPITAHQLLEAGEKQLAASAQDEIALRADLTGLVGNLYWDVGDYDKGQLLLRQSVAMSDDSRVPDAVKARNLHLLARTEDEKNEFDAAAIHARQGLALASRAGRAGVREASEARRTLARAVAGQGNSQDAETLLRKALADDRAEYGERSQPVVDDLAQLASALKEQSRFDDSIAISREGIDVVTALHGRLNSGVINGLETLASAQGHGGDYVGAERNLREAVAIADQVFGAEHRETMVAQSNLLWALEAQGRYAEALSGRLLLLQSEEKIHQSRPEQSAYAYNFLSSDYQGLGRFAEAEAASRKSLMIWASIHGSSDEWDSADALNNLGVTLTLQGRYGEARDAFRREIAIQRAHETPESEWLARSRGNLGTALRLDHQAADAAREISKANAAIQASGEKPTPIRAVLLAQLAEAQVDAGDVASARLTAADSLRTMRSLVPSGNPRLAVSLFALGRADLAGARAIEAEPLLREALLLRSPLYTASDPRVLEVKVALANALAALGKDDEAHALIEEIEPLLRTSSSPYATDLLARLPAHGRAPIGARADVPRRTIALFSRASEARFQSCNEAESLLREAPTRRLAHAGNQARAGDRA